MYYTRLVLAATALLLTVHVVNGLWTCYNEFCPGEFEGEYVYEYVDDNTGKTMIVIDGKEMSVEEYKKMVKD